MRLTFGRRLAIGIIGLLVGALFLSTLGFVFRAQQAERRALDSLHGSTSPLSAFISDDLSDAAARLEFEADIAAESGTPRMLERIELAGFVGNEIVADPESATILQASTNFLQRVSEQTSIGPTRTLGSDVTVLIGTPLPPDAPDPGLLLALHDAEPLIEGLTASRTGDTVEVLGAVRNANGALVLFTPSRHNNDLPLGAPGDELDALLNDALDEEVAVERSDILIDDRRVLAVAEVVPGTRWVLVATMDRHEAGIDLIPGWLPWSFVLLGMLAGVPAFLLRRRLKDVLRGAQQLARGQEIHELTDSRSDEIGEMSVAIEGIVDQLKFASEHRGQTAAMLQHRATHDPLTGLANRARLMEELKSAIDDRTPTAVLFCDIDDFKGINDTQGHEGGDIVLKHVANALAAVCDPTDVIARFGGDEFCVLSRSDGQTARQLASRVERALDTTVPVNESQQKVGGSVGLAIAKVTDTPDSVLKSADLAMYREKERRRGLRRSRRKGDDQLELSPEQIRLAFQPVVELEDQQIVGVEVLARYQHPELGMLDPSTFLLPGTERGMFDRFDLEILTRSLTQLGEWLSRGVVDERFTMSINLSPDHISDSDSVRQLFEIIRTNRVPATMVQIEVTEHQLLAHQDDLLNSLNTLRESGMKVALDDFGMEGSNVDRLLQIPCDVVKIDRNYVSEIDVDERAEQRLRAILEIVMSKDLVSIAEGVERVSQADMLRSMNVPMGQGYLWHAPISAIALAPLLGRASRWSRKKPAPRGR